MEREQDSQDDSELTNVNRDYDCYCLGKKIINASARVVLTFIISVIVLVFSFVFMFTQGQITIFAPIVAGVVGFWLPSPVQSSQSRKDALQSARLMQNNMRMNRLMMRYGVPRPRFEGGLGSAVDGDTMERGESSDNIQQQPQQTGMSR